MNTVLLEGRISSSIESWTPDVNHDVGVQFELEWSHEETRCAVTVVAYDEMANRIIKHGRFGVDVRVTGRLCGYEINWVLCDSLFLPVGCTEDEVHE